MFERIIHGMSTGRRVVVVGGGLAGLAAALKLGACGNRVTILEARPRLGGRASSFQDADGSLLDTCQHVSMGCCTYFADFCRTLGIGHFLKRQTCLYFMTPDRRVSRFRADPWPAPLHLARSFVSLHFLTPVEKARVLYGLAALRRTTPDTDPPLLEWLLAHGQTQRLVDRFWGLVLVSALNEAPQRIGLKYARKVFVEAFLQDRTGFDVYLPTVPLGRFYGTELSGWLARHGVDVRLQTGVRRLVLQDRRVTGVELRDGTMLSADAVVCAVPFDRLVDLLPESVRGEKYFHGAAQLQASPITSVHAWFDRPGLNLPHVVLVEGLGQWVFPRATPKAGEHYLQVVVSAAHALRGLGGGEIERRVAAELRGLFPPLREAKLLRCRVVTEHAATFSAVPGVDALRPPQRSPLANLALAGDWTRTGWPATMEGAVRSGYLAAAALSEASADANPARESSS
jgi:squalene-associated FAD-dependent desaturase